MVEDTILEEFSGQADFGYPVSVEEPLHASEFANAEPIEGVGQWFKVFGSVSVNGCDDGWISRAFEGLKDLLRILTPSGDESEGILWGWIYLRGCVEVIRVVELIGTIDAQRVG